MRQTVLCESLPLLRGVGMRRDQRNTGTPPRTAPTNGDKHSIPEMASGPLAWVISRNGTSLVQVFA